MLDNFTFKVADPVERLAALRLQAQVYAEDTGHVPADQFDESGFYFVAVTQETEIVASFRMVGPEQRPFDIERFVDLSPFLAADRSPALIGRLCIRHDHRSVSRKVFLPLGMLKLAYAFSWKHGFTDLVMYTFPHLLGFYRGALFQPLNLTFQHPGYGCAMHVMHLDLIDVERRRISSEDPSLQRLLSAEGYNILV